MKRIILLLVSIGMMSLFAANGAMLTQRCAGCHGAKFEKAPFGRADHIVKGKSYDRIVKMLKYYQHPKESDEMVMKPQVAHLNEKQIETIAKYIVGLK